MSNVSRPSLEIEKSVWRSGVKVVAGIDEVGVGSLAGPVTAAAVALTPNEKYNWSW